LTIPPIGFLLHGRASRRRGLVSVSTEGASPALAQVIRTLMRDRLPRHLGSVARQLRAERAALHASGDSTEGVDWKPRIQELLDEAGPVDGTTSFTKVTGGSLHLRRHSSQYDKGVP
jgi:hypothetical protein